MRFIRRRRQIAVVGTIRGIPSGRTVGAESNGRGQEKSILRTRRTERIRRSETSSRFENAKVTEGGRRDAVSGPARGVEGITGREHRLS